MRIILLLLGNVLAWAYIAQGLLSPAPFPAPQVLAACYQVAIPAVSAATGDSVIVWVEECPS